MDYIAEIGGRNVHLRYTVNSMCAIEDAEELAAVNDLIMAQLYEEEE